MKRFFLLIFIVFLISLLSVTTTITINQENFLDKTILCYNKLYNLHKLAELKNKKYKFFPYNAHENYYQTSEVNRRDLFTPFNYLVNLNIYKPIQKDFPLRKDLTTDFNCQREYMTCTKCPVPRYPFKEDPKIIKYK